MSKKFNSARNRRGQGLVEYIIIVAAVAMISLVAVSIFGHKVADQYAIGAGMLPGAHLVRARSNRTRLCGHNLARDSRADGNSSRTF